MSMCWIPVGERLPEHDQEVIIYWLAVEAGDERAGVSTGYYRCYEPHWYDYNYPEEVEYPGVTHWMPLPTTDMYEPELAAKDALIARLREDLQYVRGYYGGFPEVPEIESRVRATLALPNDDTALQAALQQARAEEREICITVVSEIAKMTGSPELGQVAANVLRKRGPQ